ncbi:hypothetical protein VTH82DRAFT_2452 [Thermothelomyces myriococcoides]
MTRLDLCFSGKLPQYRLAVKLDLDSGS